MLLSVVLLLVGGGLFPPVIGFVAGAVATRINVPVTRQPGRVLSFLARLWPWPLVAFLVWAFGQFLVGYFFNELLMQSGFLSPLLIIGLLVLSIFTGHAHDLEDRGPVAVG